MHNLQREEAEEMKLLWVLVFINYSSWDGRMTQTHQLGSYDTKQECEANIEKLRRSAIEKYICTKTPPENYVETKKVFTIV